MKVPFVDLTREYSKILTDIKNEIDTVCANANFILGKQVSEFENEFAKFIGSDFCSGVANGTDALALSFKALGLKAGDEVVMPSHTFVATAIGILEAGAIPKLIDIDEKSFLMNLDALESAISNKTRAICPVHLYGRAVNMDAIMEIARKRNLFVVEDSAQAHGARWKGRRVGSFGDAGCFSFFPAKNLGAFGDGGAVASSRSDVNSAIRRLRNYGSEIRYHHPERGANSRLDTIQAAILSVKLKSLDTANQSRLRMAKLYNSLLKNISPELIQIPEIPEDEQHVFHLYVIRSSKRDYLRSKLAESGIDTGIHYPNPWYLESGYSFLGLKAGQFGITEKISNQILSLPMFPGLREDEANYVADKITSILKA